MKRKLVFAILWGMSIMLAISAARADTLILANKQKVQGSLSLIADDYLEFRVEKSLEQFEWIKIPKKSLFAVLSDQGKVVYPRDKFDENALNFGKVKLRDKKEVDTFLKRKKANRLAQAENEKSEKGKYKVAAIIGGLSGLMLWAVIDTK